VGSLLPLGNGRQILYMAPAGHVATHQREEIIHRAGPLALAVDRIHAEAVRMRADGGREGLASG